MVIKTVETQLVPVLKNLPGFKGYYAIKFEGGDLGSVSIFDKKENADSANEKATGWIKQNLVSELSSEPMVLRGDILFSHAAPMQAAAKAA
jgi:hypothetical protein